MKKETGPHILHDPLRNKDTAFTLKEREQYQLFGLLPPHIETIEEQLARVDEELHMKTSDLERYIYLRALQDRNEILFFRYVVDNVDTVLPIIYTPVVGDACEQFHRIYRQPRGLFISYPERDQMDKVFASVAQERDIKVIVVTDGERILGLGDQGSGGLGIPIGKLALYSACGGVHPQWTLPIVLDVGTNNQQRLQDATYMGWRHERIIGQDYDDFLEQFVQTVKKYFPEVLLQFEDFAQTHAYPLLERYQDSLCTFNDDIQGTASVAVAAILSAVKISKRPWSEHRVAVLGAGSAGCGVSKELVAAFVAQGIPEDKAWDAFYLVDRHGLLHDEMDDLLPFQKPFAKPLALLKQWKKEQPFTLMDVIHYVKPTILIGLSGQPNQFNEAMIREMASYCERPIIFPLSNPTSRSEAIPSYLLEWTNGQALIATGSPFIPVQWKEQTIEIAQSNNVYIFPGIGLAVIAGKIRRITEKMMLASAFALSELAPAIKTGKGRLLPPVAQIRDVSLHIAKAVLRQAIKEGHSDVKPGDVDVLVQKAQWFPTYEA